MYFFSEEIDFPGKESMLDSFKAICRDQTPSFYEGIQLATTFKNNEGLPNVAFSSLGTSKNFPKQDVDIFGKGLDTSKAHIFPDSNTCGPAWALMAEGATGKIQQSENINELRLLRMMGAKQSSKGKKPECLRLSVCNFISLGSDHRKYYDENPQLLIIPILDLNGVKDWDGKTAYDVLVLASSAYEDDAQSPADSLKTENKKKEITPANIYKNILSGYEWNEYKKEDHSCNDKEINQAFETLACFVKALAHTLMLEIPIGLLEKKKESNSDKKNNKKTNTNNKSSTEKNKKKTKKLGKSKKDRKSTSTKSTGLPTLEEDQTTTDGNTFTNRNDFNKKEELISAKKKLEEDNSCKVPKLKSSFNGHALKVKLADPLPDPWLLMAKAGVNFSALEYKYKFLPACMPPPDKAQVEYEEAYMQWEMSRYGIPTEISLIK